MDLRIHRIFHFGNFDQRTSDIEQSRSVVGLLWVEIMAGFQHYITKSSFRLGVFAPLCGHMHVNLCAYGWIGLKILLRFAQQLSHKICHHVSFSLQIDKFVLHLSSFGRSHLFAYKLVCLVDLLLKARERHRAKIFFFEEKAKQTGDASVDKDDSV